MMERIDVGTRGAAIVLGTDSPQTPEVRLQLIEEGYRRPPFVLQFQADLFYPQGFSKSEVREATVEVVIPEGRRIRVRPSARIYLSWNSAGPR